MSHSREKLRADYLGSWHHAQVDTGDIDPVYPVFGYLADQSGMTADDRAWLVFLHVAFYHPGSSLAAFEVAPSPEAIPSRCFTGSPLLVFPTGTERRGHRDVRKRVEHLLALQDLFAGIGPDAWVWSQFEHDSSAEDRWETLTEGLLSIHGNGRWAAYKAAEMLQKVCGYPIAAPDAGHRYSSGPRKGLAHLFAGLPEGNDPTSIATLDLYTDLLMTELGETDVALVETSLCDFNSLVSGRYYLGHDIDSMLGDLRHPAVADRVPLLTWEARSAVFPEELLGEAGAERWTGVRKQLNSIYRSTGEIR
jgi:hypothetical protein